MPNFICIHKQSNLIIKLVSSSSTPTSTNSYGWLQLSDIQADKYWKLKDKLDHSQCVDLGDLLLKCPALYEQLSTGKTWGDHTDEFLERRLSKMTPTQRHQLKKVA
ncbi:MAG: hypothetical protein QXJ64_04455 [Thermosphaera sp.]|uniref:hypothetical protein n=1 Tax=Pseudomonas nitroreducens TaxID=46680 RepID=UPI001E5A7781|nr:MULTISPECIES: hypothetical protein [Pseudomonas]MCE4069657.1 hypothetical protein [Pseudomonas nitritireducens]MCE4079180.1 hypothetical protein [Pseudomonas nitroreducens]